MSAKASKTLPTHDRSHLVLLPRDPDWAIAQWEIDEADVAHGIDRLSSFGGLVGLVLRVYVIEDDRPRARVRSPLREYPVQHWLGSHVVLLGHPGTLHQAVLGLRDESGTFSPIVRSALVSSPAAKHSAAQAESTVRVPPPEIPGTPLTCTPVPTDDGDGAHSAPTGGGAAKNEGEVT